MNIIVEILKNDHIRGASVSGLCTIILALFFKKIMHMEVPYNGVHASHLLSLAAVLVNTPTVTFLHNMSINDRWTVHPQWSPCEWPC